ncbi:MAG TPA: UDP-N-acetylmuramoyl-tripeptide--D-alanyl-D-alanine ligase [Bacillota bacterium]|nr:UDP-N-acetylmuramoyl-tripeptide--D-alanyl-D-alanine ligase [Bacillota bacterium]
MPVMTVGEIAQIVHGTIRGTHQDKIITSIITDSRQSRDGALFIALKGERVDGNQFIVQAILAGAAAALTEETELQEGLSAIVVEDCIEAMARLGRYCLEKFPVKVVAITGSVGKTSSKDMIAAVLAEKYSVLKTQGNLNTETGLPITLYQLKLEHQIAVLEMGMQGLGEIAHLTTIAPPDFAAITNVLGVHLERLGSIKAIATAKREIFQGLKAKTGVGLLRWDEPCKDFLLEKLAGNSYTYGFSEEADLSLSDVISLGLYGSSFTLHFQNQEEVRATIPLPGRHMVENAALAAAIGYLNGLTPEEIALGLSHVQPVDQRSSIQHLGGDRLLIDDSYNASPKSMQVSLDLMSEVRSDRCSVAVLADMRELGEQEIEEHEIVGRRLAAEGYDYIFLKGALAAALGRAALANGMPEDRVFFCADNQAMVEAVLKTIPEHAILLVKGSRSLALEEVVEQLQQSWGEGNA